MIALRALREDEYEAWDAAHRAEYEHGLVEFAGMARTTRGSRSTAISGSILPPASRRRTSGSGPLEEDGRRVGTVFLGRRGGDLWLYDITIDADERGKGYGRGAMLALEEEVRLSATSR